MIEKPGPAWMVWMMAALVFLGGLGCGVCSSIPQLPLGDTPVPPTPVPTTEPVSTAPLQSTPTDSQSTPTEPQSTPTEPQSTPTEPPAPAVPAAMDMVPYMNPVAGFSVLYPEGWVYEAERAGVVFSESTESLESGEPSEVPICVFFSGAPEEIEYELGEVTTAEALLDTLLVELCVHECETGELDSWSFGDTPGVGRKVSWSESWGSQVQGYMVAALSDEVAGFGLGAAPEDAWALFEPIFQEMIASAEFFAPQEPKLKERGAIQPDGTVRGVVTVSTIEVWTFDAQEGEYVTIGLDAVRPEELDTYLEIYDDDGSSVAEDDDGGEGTNSMIPDLGIERSGTYYIYVSSYEGEGDYRLALTVADEPSGGGEIVYGESVEGVLYGGGAHEYKFQGGSGDAISIGMSALGSELDCYLELLSPEGDTLVFDDDSGGSLDALIEYYVLPADGLYRIIASDISGESGQYELFLRIAQLSIKGTLVPGQTVSAALERGSRHHWLFDGKAGDFVTISMDALAKDLDVYLEVYTPNGEQVATDDDSGGNSNAAIFELELTDTGPYRVVGRGYNDEQAGAYELTLEMVELTIQGTLTPDLPVTARVEPGQRHNWLFEGQQGKVVSISMTAMESGLDAFLALYAPGGEQVATDDDSGGDYNAAILDFELPIAGTYRVIARGYAGTDTGEYELALTER
jgi:hypothetical protein